MRDIVNTYVRKFKKERRTRRRFIGVVAVLALSLTTGIMWRLHVTGIALTNEAYCGKEEHTHSDECYIWKLSSEISEEDVVVENIGEISTDLTSVRVLSAEEESEEEAILSEDDQIADASGLVQDTDLSAESVEEATSQTEDTKEDALTDPDELDSLGAVPEEDDTEEEQALDEDETTALENTADEEDTVSEASAEWYLANGYSLVLVCELEEHEHTIECISDYSADVETADDWEADLPELTGVWADDIVAIAVSQIGYAESTANYILAENGEAHLGYSRYGAWYGSGFEYVNWDSLFAAFCLRYAGISEDDFPVNSGAYAWAVELNSLGLYADAADYTSLPGDLVFFDTDDDDKIDRVGIVTALTQTSENEDPTDTLLTVVEGNCTVDDADIVASNQYLLTDNTISGYGVLPEQEDSALAEITNEKEDTNEEEDSLEEMSESEEVTSKGEEGDPEAIQALVDSGFFEYWSNVIAEEENTENQILLSASSSAFTLRSVIAGFLGSSMTSSSSQITEDGGSVSSDDGVSISKYITGTDTENVFDITLTVETTTNVSELYTEPDMAVVIVMDISNSMSTAYDGTTTRYEAAVTAAEAFIDEFASETTGVSQIGFVAFNTDAMEIFDLSSCASVSDATTLKNIIRTDTGEVMKKYLNHSSEYYITKRFTNIEAGLKMASDMLDSATNENKYIIFLSDGFPTTYLRNNTSTSDYSGWNPYMSATYNSEYNSLNKTIGADGYFYNAIYNMLCTDGTSYSDKAAIRAREMATQIKSSGTTIFSVGVDIGGQTISGFATYVVDTLTNQYEIGSADNANAFKNWLQNSIGSGYYYDSHDLSGLQSAFDEIIDTIQKMNAESAEAKWVATDPLPTFSGSTDTTVEFLGFYDSNNVLQVYEPNDTLSGSNVENGENSASYVTDSSSISWDLKKSGYAMSTSGSTTTYIYTLTYRVRLQNESSTFTEGVCYATNGDASLTYQTVTTEGGETKISEEKTLAFPIPEVKGYLGELTFTKVDQDGNALAGVTFTLSHDTTICTTCRGDGSSSVSLDDLTATSGVDGIVSFTNIPSGHTYTLTETGVPEGYSANNKTYIVNVAYDVVNVTETDSGGTSKTWSATADYTIVNYSDPTVEKKVLNDEGNWGDYNSASIGEAVQFKTTIDNALGASNLVLHDQLSAGLDDPYVTRVYVVDSSGIETDLTAGYTVTYYKGEHSAAGVSATDGCSFEISFEDSTLNALSEDDLVVINYIATLTTNAIIGNTGYPTTGGNPNETYISYGSDSYSEHDTTITYTYEVDILKYSGDQKLSGAEFILYYTETVQIGESDVTEEITYYAKVNRDDTLTGWTTDRTEATTLTSNSGGMIYIKGLGPGTYYLEETKAPDGYSLLSAPVVITVTEDGTVNYTVEINGAETSGTGTVQVENKPGYELPLTGGSGTFLYRIAGLLLTGGAAYLLFNNLRRRKRSM